jgi:hypothetical protein
MLMTGKMGQDQASANPVLAIIFISKPIETATFHF